MSPGVIVFAETDEGTFELLTKGRELSKLYNTKLSALVIGKKDEKEIEKFFEYGADKVVVWPNENVRTFETDAYVHVLFEVTKQNGPDVLLIRSSRLGKEVAGRVAQRLQAGCVTDAIAVSLKGSELVVDRYALGGNTISSEIIKTNKKVISVTPRAFEAQPSAITGNVEKVELEKPPECVELVELRKKVGESANIESAENLVCVGKGLGSKEDLAMVNELCLLLKAELGCSRALSADYHWIAEDRMVGISGKKCKPKLDVSIGISGQIQHTVGIMSAKIIVAINKDKEAPIFKIADYGVVGDLYQIIPKLIQRIKAQNG